MDDDLLFDFQLDNVDVFVKNRKRRKHYPKGWLVSWPELLMCLMMRLSKREIIVLMCILSHTKRHNRAHISRNLIASKTEIAKNHVDTIIKKLRNEGFIKEKKGEGLL